VAFFIEKFDPAELHQYEQARDHSIELLEEWLAKYKFKNWAHTRTNNTEVTPAMRRERAAQIAAMLNETKKWKSHGRGLSMKLLENDVGLQIEDFGKNSDLNQRIRSYYRLLQNYMLTARHSLVIQTTNRYLGI
jgi:hypothetical protein